MSRTQKWTQKKNTFKGFILNWLVLTPTQWCEKIWLSLNAELSYHILYIHRTMSKSNLNNQSDAKKENQPGIDYQPDFFLLVSRIF